MMKFISSAILLVCTVLFMACDRTPVIQVEPKANDPYKENMINANKYIEQSENTQISSFVERRGWKMRQLNNGAWIEIQEQGKGSKVEYDDTVTIHYNLSSLNGSVFYTGAAETFIVGRRQTTVGIDRAIMECNRGASARIILPSSLGYGVVGDGDRVPSRAVLVYELLIE